MCDSPPHSPTADCIASGPILLETFAGRRNVPGSTNGKLLDTKFEEPAGLAYDQHQEVLYVGDANGVRRVDIQAGNCSHYINVTTGVNGLAIGADVLWILDRFGRIHRNDLGKLGSGGAV